DITVSNIYSTTLTEADTWMKSSGQTTILSTASIRFDADPINGYILMQPSSTTDFFLSQPNSSNFFVAQPLDGCAGSQPARQANLIQTNEDEISLSKFDLFPNPAKNKITIQNKGLNETDIHFEIFSIEGKIRLSQRDIRFSNKAEIDISMLNTGIYFIKIINGNQVEMIKFTKE
ncbi:MAG TPA: T9SS type A sorting domain-containing protein, partial [Chitinophagaceae bacterium]|nr:T9SS type A sorting domain-containing protein [Chitinophagaceae bacterium]